MIKEFTELINNLAIEAMINGLELSIEHKDYIHDTRGLGPSVGGGHAEDRGIVFRIYQPERDEEQEAES